MSFGFNFPQMQHAASISAEQQMLNMAGYGAPRPAEEGGAEGVERL